MNSRTFLQQVSKFQIPRLFLCPYKPAVQINPHWLTLHAVLFCITYTALQLYLSISDFTNHLFCLHQLETIIVGQLLPLSSTLMPTQ